MSTIPRACLRYLRLQAVAPTTPGEVDRIIQFLRANMNDVVSSAEINQYFATRAYRQKRERSSSRSVRPRKIKSSDEVTALQKLWTAHAGKCPPRVAVRDVLSRSNLTYSDIQQWFGQKKYTMRRAIKSRDESTATLQHRLHPTCDFKNRLRHWATTARTSPQQIPGISSEFRAR